MELIEVKESTIILPVKETPKHCLRISDLDLMQLPIHASNVFFYRPPNDSGSFYDMTKLLKESLSQVLVSFYPMAGRYERDENGRIQIRCNGEGVLFKVTEASCAIDDLGDFTQVLKLREFVPAMDTTKDISSYPILMTQVTYFKCGGVSLGVALHHTLADAISTFHFIKSWAEMARGLPVSIPPIFDSTPLGIGVPTSPKFHHIEYDPPPSMNNSTQNLGPISHAIVTLSSNQINILKGMVKTDHGSTVNYSRFEIIAAHVWRCMCRARGLPNDQASKLSIPTDGRSRLNPPLSPGVVGNVLFRATSMALVGNIILEPLNFTVERIHKALKRMDDEYLKSALAYLKQLPDLPRGQNTYNSPNLDISNVSVMPVYDGNFGWGRPMFVRALSAEEGSTHICPSPSNDGSLLVLINLETHRIQLFKKLFYEIFVQTSNARSRY